MLGGSSYYHNDIKSCVSVFGHQGTSYSWLSGFRGMFHVPKHKSLSGESLRLLLLQVSVCKHLEIGRPHSLSACEENIDRTQAK